MNLDNAATALLVTLAMWMAYRWGRKDGFEKGWKEAQRIGRDLLLRAGSENP